MARIDIPIFADKVLLVDWLIANKTKLVAQKKAEKKDADSIILPSFFITDATGATVKTDGNSVSPDATRIKVRSIINTTKYFDSHGDVHIDQLWNKSLKESKGLFLVSEHNFSFSGIISDNVKAFAKQMTWHELGFNFEGSTQALVFDSILDKQGSPRVNNDYTMFDLYRMNKVKEHSVGMRYIEIDLAVNDDRYEKENAIWNKYFDDIANKEDVLAAGYFWAVTQAKVIEGSAVLRGANPITPTQSVTQIKSEQPGKPIADTNQPVKAIDWKELVNNYQPKKYV
jgi:hypothetical protein